MTRVRGFEAKFRESSAWNLLKKTLDRRIVARIGDKLNRELIGPANRSDTPSNFSRIAAPDLALSVLQTTSFPGRPFNIRGIA